MRHLNLSRVKILHVLRSRSFSLISIFRLNGCCCVCLNLLFWLVWNPSLLNYSFWRTLSANWVIILNNGATDIASTNIICAHLFLITHILMLSTIVDGLIQLLLLLHKILHRLKISWSCILCSSFLPLCDQLTLVLKLNLTLNLFCLLRCVCCLLDKLLRLFSHPVN